MSKFKDIAKRALANQTNAKNSLNEGRVTYDENHPERIHPTLSKQLRHRAHSLGNHPAFPASDEMHFEEKIISRRFNDILKTYKRHHGVEVIDPNQVKVDGFKTLKETMQIEHKHKTKLVELAVRMVREEFDMGEDDVKIIAELTPMISIEGVRKNPTPMVIEDMEFDNHDSISSANDEVYKRRFVNAMIQGAAKKCNHMFHMVDKELMEMDHKLPVNYGKLMSAADYGYLINDDSENKVAGGIVKTELPKKDGDIPVIHAQAMTFPVLIHELVKGTMELLSTHGLPKDKKLTEYVLGKADFMAAETWDMRLGPAMWEQFTDAIDADDFHLKHHIYQELVSLPVKEFNIAMREIMAGTKEGKKIVSDIADDIKADMKYDEYNSAMNEMSDDDNDQFGPEDIDGIDMNFF